MYKTVSFLKINKKQSYFIYKCTHNLCVLFCSILLYFFVIADEWIFKVMLNKSTDRFNFFCIYFSYDICIEKKCHFHSILPIFHIAPEGDWGNVSTWQDSQWHFLSHIARKLVKYWNGAVWGAVKVGTLKSGLWNFFGLF